MKTKNSTAAKATEKKLNDKDNIGKGNTYNGLVMYFGMAIVVAVVILGIAYVAIG